MNKHLLTWATGLLAAAALSACSGGGGGTTVTLTGVVAKGLTSHADVGVYAITSGAVAATPLVTAVTTGTDGTYSLSFSPTTGQQYVVRASARSDGSTSHLDEVSNLQQTLPSQFAMRSLMTASGGATAVVNLTPFSELAVAAAEHDTGGLTTANAAQAVSTVAQLFTFNPSAVTPASVALAVGADQQKLAVLLAAVSEMANDATTLATLGCTGSTIVSAGDKTTCVVNQLAAAGQTSTIHLGETVSGSSVDVSKILSDAVLKVLNDTRLNPVVNGVPTVSPALMTPTLANLACSADCQAAPPSTGAAPVATAIAAAKVFFNTMVNDVTQMFSNDGVTASSAGKVNQTVYQIQQSMDGVYVPARQVFYDLAMLQAADNLIRAYQSGQTTTPESDTTAGSSYGVGGDGIGEIFCYIYTDSTFANEVSSPADLPGSVTYCSVDTDRGTLTTARGDIYGTAATHQVFVTLRQGGDGYDYSARARHLDVYQECIDDSCVSGITYKLDAGGNIAMYYGTYKPVVDSNGTVTSAAIAGDLPPSFGVSTGTWTTDHVSAALNGVITGDVSATQTVALTGTVSTYAPDTAAQATQLQFKTTQVDFAGQAYIGDPTRFQADIALTYLPHDSMQGAQIEGTVLATDVVWDKTHFQSTPATITAQVTIGTLATAGGTPTQVLQVNAQRTVTGFATYDGRFAATAANTYLSQISGTGSITAPSEPTLEFSVSGTTSKYATSPDLLSLQYRRMVGGAPTQVVAGVATRDPVTGLYTATLADNADNLSVTLTQHSQVSPKLMLAGSTEIGEFNLQTSVLTFTDGSFMSLALGF